jgi:hypothetical protein
MMVWGAGMAGYRSKARSLNNAYMLVYVRDADWDKVMAPTGKEEVSEHVRKQLEQHLSAKDAKRRAKMQAHRFVSFKIVTDSLMQKHVRPCTLSSMPCSMVLLGAQSCCAKCHDWKDVIYVAVSSDSASKIYTAACSSKDKQSVKQGMDVQVEAEAFHLVNTDELPEDHCFKLDKTLTWSAVMQRIEALTGIPSDQQLYFLFAQHGHHQRPSVPVFPQVHITAIPCTHFPTLHFEIMLEVCGLI